MKELVKTIDAAIKDEGFTDHGYELRSAAERWAIHSLGTYTGPLLRKALAISAAFAEFANELNALSGGGGGVEP